jgi:hypothetical protein
MTGRGRERGIALMLVLWVFMTLGVIALDFSRYIRDDAMAAVNYGAETRGYYTAVAGVHFAIWQARHKRIWIPPPPGVDPEENAGMLTGDGDSEIVDADGDGKPENLIVLNEWYQGPVVGEGVFQVKVTDEDAKVSLNDASDDVLRALVTGLIRGGNATEGVGRAEERDIDDIMEAIRVWRDPSNASEGGIGGNEHRMDLRRRSKITWFTFTEELLSVPGITPELFYGHDDVPGLVDLVSPFSKRDAPNPDTMTAEIRELLAEQLPALPAGDGSGSLSVIRIRVCADVREARNQSRIEAIVRIDPDSPGGATRMMRWIDRAPSWSDADGCRADEAAA